MAKIKHLILAISSLSLLPTITYAQNYNSNTIGIAMMNLNAATLRGSNAYTMKDIWSNMRQDFRMTEVNPEIIRRQEQAYATKSAYFNRIVSRSQPYLYHILTEVEKRGMPTEIALLPFIESAFVTKAKSPVGASGLWQFMPATGRHYGLEQTYLYDGRHDVYAATDAALTYLQYLHGLFGDWSLALAAYNWGEGNVTKAVLRAQAAGLDPVYENLRMPNETRNYVPKLLAVRNIINNPEAFNLSLERIDNKPVFQAINLNQAIDLQSIANLAHISTQELLALNPSFNVPVFIPKENRKLLLPISSIRTFERNYQQADKNALLSWNIFTTPSTMSISDLSQQSGMSIGEIKSLNGLSGNNIAAGRSLLLSKNTFNSQDFGGITNIVDTDLQSNTKPIPINPTPVLVANASSVTSRQNSIQNTQAYSQPVINNTATTSDITVIARNTQPVPISSNVAQSNDPLMDLANEATLRVAASEAVQKSLSQNSLDDAKPTLRYAANKVDRSDNNRDDNIENRITKGASTHKVMQGDTLFSIAQRYNVNVADLVTANNINGTNIHTGQVLKVALSPSKNNLASTKNRNNIQPVAYTVKRGDTLSSISAQLNIPVSKLQKMNKGEKLQPGQKIKLTNM